MTSINGFKIVLLVFASTALRRYNLINKTRIKNIAKKFILIFTASLTVLFGQACGQQGFEAQDFGSSAYPGTGNHNSNQATVPLAPSNLTVQALAQTQLTLTWQDNSTNEVGFKIERAISNLGPFSQVAAVQVNVLTFQDNFNLSPSTVYYYRILAINNQGTSTYSNIAQGTTLATGITPPILDVPPVILGPMIYVDSNLTVASCATYSPASRNCAGGTQNAYRTIAAASALSQPGLTILIRAGTYAEQIRPARSGAAGTPITFSSYNNEIVKIQPASSSTFAVDIQSRSYIIISGISVADNFWLEAKDSHYNEIKNNSFERTVAGGTTGNIRFIQSSYNKIQNNIITSGVDNINLMDCHHMVISGNNIQNGRHSLVSVRCSDYTIIRGNSFSNPLQKIMEVYDCASDTPQVPFSVDSTKHNAIEDNIFSDTSTYYATTGGNGIQYAGQEGIVRRNFFYNNNVGIALQTYSDEALYNRDNRVYGNVMYNNDCAGIALSGANKNNVLKNNILSGNHGADAENCFAESSTQLMYRGSLGQNTFLDHNNIYSTATTNQVVQSEFSSTISALSAFPQITNSLQVDPLFVRQAEFDFRLQATSPLIDAGAYLTATTAAGSGILLSVADALYFRDDFGIAGEVGDLIQLQGQVQTARIIAINYITNTLTLDRSLSWSAGQGVSLAYYGTAPDIGAHEFSP